MRPVAVPAAGSQFLARLRQLSVETRIIDGGDVIVTEPAINRSDIFRVRKLRIHEFRVAIDTFQIGLTVRTR